MKTRRNPYSTDATATEWLPENTTSSGQDFAQIAAQWGEEQRAIDAAIVQLQLLVRACMQPSDSGCRTIAPSPESVEAAQKAIAELKRVGVIK